MENGKGVRDWVEGMGGGVLFHLVARAIQSQSVVGFGSSGLQNQVILTVLEQGDNSFGQLVGIGNHIGQSV